MKKSLARKSSSDGLRVVALGGGTGLSALLRGLKEHVVRRSDKHPTAKRPITDLAAIVTVTDDGGSSGGSGERIAFCLQGIFATAW